MGNANAGALKTRGIDLDGDYFHELPWGLLESASSIAVETDWTWVDEYTLFPIQGLPSVSYPCVGAYGPTCLDPIPSFKGVTRITWSNGPVDLSLRYRFINSVTVDTYLLPLRTGGTVPPLDTLANPVLPSANYLDLSAIWNVNSELQLSGWVNNIFGWCPPVVGSASEYGNTWPATYDPHGQEFFLDFKAKFQ